MKPIKEKKHNHILTDYLKVLIFSILMLLPFFSIATRSLYVICNKNAYQSYYGKTINNYETTLITNINEFNMNDQYIFNSGTFNIKDTVIPQGAYAYFITCTNVNIISTNINNLPSEINSFAPYLDNSGKLNIRLNNDNNYLYGLSTYYLVFDFYYVSDNLTYNFAYNNMFSKITYNSYSFLDNVYEYSIDQLENDNYISWTKNTALFNGVITMTNSLGIETNTIAMLITYWFFLIIIYVIIDIILHMFVWLTHMIGKA